MTGDELREARLGCGLSREDVGQLLGVAGQVVGAWERLGTNHIAATRPRESAATRAAKAKLPMVMRYMASIGAIGGGLRELIPCPCDWMPILSRGDPLVLSEDEAVEGDLVLLRDGTGELSTVARVMVEREAGRLMCFVRPYQAMELPPKENYRTIEYAMVRLHDGIPDRVEWSSVVPPDLI